jgi:Na+-transporting NADH:ubiquinone oxidoreductase subunit NqrB
MAVWIGLYPHTFLNMIDAPSQNIINQVQPYLAQHGDGLFRLASSLFGGN